MSNLKNILIIKEPLAPSKEQHSIIPNQFIWRTEKQFIGNSSIVIADIQEAIWWNRPLKSEAMCKLEDDGLYSYNLPFWQRDKEQLVFKTGYNVLLNKNSIPIAIHIQTDETCGDEHLQLLKNMLSDCLHSTLIKLGVNAAALTYNGNDMYFENRKFACSEQIFEDNVFTQNTIVTLLASPEKDLFDRLTGKYAHAKTITGIAEEVPTVTKETFIDTLYKNLQDYINTNFS